MFKTGYSLREMKRNGNIFQKKSQKIFINFIILVSSSINTSFLIRLSSTVRFLSIKHGGIKNV